MYEAREERSLHHHKWRLHHLRYHDRILDRLRILLHPSWTELQFSEMAIPHHVPVFLHSLGHVGPTLSARLSSMVDDARTV